MNARRDGQPKRPRKSWDPILAIAAAYVESLGYLPTLREVHYRLVGEAAHLGYANVKDDYTTLSKKTAEGRRDGTFPDLADNTRVVQWRDPRPAESLADFASTAASRYGVDLQAGQPERVVVVVEKRTLVSGLVGVAGEYGVPVLALAGYASQSFVPYVRQTANGYPGYGQTYYTVTDTSVLYLGDHDPSGWGIMRDIANRADLDPERLFRLGVTPEQVAEYNLAESIGKDTDARADEFVAEFGSLVQVECEALAAALPDGLAGLVRPEIEARLDLDLIEEQRDRELADRVLIAEALAGLLSAGGQQPAE